MPMNPGRERQRLLPYQRARYCNISDSFNKEGNLKDAVIRVLRDLAEEIVSDHKKDRVVRVIQFLHVLNKILEAGLRLVNASAPGGPGGSDVHYHQMDLVDHVQWIHHYITNGYAQTDTDLENFLLDQLALLCDEGGAALFKQ